MISMRHARQLKPLYCAQCREGRGNGGPSVEYDVSVIHAMPDGRYVIRCGRCGHEWVSRSSAARRLAGGLSGDSFKGESNARYE
jgi:hypothetical protein